jgi:FKBP-type peptidyl-prolyl cis-trans isomerase SlyD|nr:peptidylprolyl isomerase [Candidatus Krumholzibacteria bacterium]
MQIADKCVVFMHYTLTDDQGQTIDSSEGRDAMPYLHGGNNIVPGLEKALTGLSAGEKIEVNVPCEEGYGPIVPEAIQTVPVEAFAQVEGGVEPGMQFQINGPEGQVQVITIKEVTEEGIVVDGNHPLAGQTLHFAVEIAEVREATEVELEHGHPHMPDSDCEV